MLPSDFSGDQHHRFPQEIGRSRVIHFPEDLNFFRLDAYSVGVSPTISLNRFEKDSREANPDSVAICAVLKSVSFRSFFEGAILLFRMWV